MTFFCVPNFKMGNDLFFTKNAMGAVEPDETQWQVGCDPQAIGCRPLT